MFLKKRADAELGGEALRQRVLRAHRLLEVIEAELGHEHRVRQVEEGAQGQPRIAPVRLVQRGQQDGDCFRVVRRQVLVQGARDVFAAWHQGQGVIPLERIGDKLARFKRRIHGGDHARDGFGHVGAVLVDERLGHGLSP